MISFDPNVSFLSLKTNLMEKEQAAVNLASGKKEDLSRKDAGTFSMNLKINGKVSFERKILHGMQSQLSLNHIQDGKLKEMTLLLNRMNELASKSTDMTKSSSDRANYNYEFLNLTNEFDNFKNTTFNGKQVFGSGATEESLEFLDSLTSHWLPATEKLIGEEYGWIADSNDSWDLVIEEAGPRGGSAAFVQSSWSLADYASQATKMSFDMPDFNSPHTVGDSTADTVVAHEMVHLLQAQNTYMGDQAGGQPDRDMTWFAEGLAEFIRGADSRAKSSLDSLGMSALLAKPNAGWGSLSDDYAGVYLALKYPDHNIKNINGAHNSSGVSVTECIKNLTIWMKAQKDTGSVLKKSGLNQYTKTFLNSDYGYRVGIATDTKGSEINAFLNDFEIANGQGCSNNLKLTGCDTVSVSAKEDTGTELNSTNIVSYDLSFVSRYSTQLKYAQEDNDDPVNIVVNANGVETSLNSIPSISFGDTKTYNLKTAQSATLTMEHIDSLLESIATVRAAVGSNLTITNNNYSSLMVKIKSMELATSRTGDVSIPDETLKLAKSSILLNLNLSMMVQANQIATDATLSLLT